MKFILKILICSATLFLITPAQAAISPASFNILPPAQFPPEDFAITGVRASLLWGQHRNMYGLDVGLIGNITEQDFVGLGVSGIFNLTEGTTRAIGLQLAGLTNINLNKTAIYGVQAALGVNYNKAETTIAGLQMAILANESAFTDIYGAQLSLYNRAKDVHGLQIGLVNVADSLHGIQIGLVNINHKGPFAVSPFINIGF